MFMWKVKGDPISKQYLIYIPNWLKQEGLAAVFGNGLSTACIVNMGAQVTSVICIEVLFMYFVPYGQFQDTKLEHFISFYSI